MAEAWMVRRGQQERVVEKLAQAFRESLDTDREEYRGISDLLVGILNGELHTVASDIDHELRNFARVIEEYEALKWRLFMKLAEVLQHQPEARLRDIERCEPWVIFRANSAMADVKIDE